ncbi:MAG TPA: type II toxin-antitoxin system HicA family toxin [Verrucomicrobiae bacterium]|nr:type II toxin-antitoxin system HicA family toxin [Verrucomicrobiae bacterium]
MKADEAETLLLEKGFRLIRALGKHRIYSHGKTRVVVPYHTAKALHPKIVKQIFQAIETVS